MTSLLNPRRCSHHLLCYLLAALTAATPPLAIAQQTREVQERVEAPVVDQPERAVTRVGDTSLLADPKPGPGNAQPADLAYAVPNSFVFIALRLAQILNSPMAEFYPTEVLQAAGIHELGVDPLTLEQVVFAVAPTIGGPPSYSVIAKFNHPIHLKPGKATAHTTRAQIAGKNYLQSNDPMLPSVHAVDSKTLLLAPDYFLRALVSSKEPAKVSNLAAAFAAADQGDDLLAMIDVAQLRPLINMGLSQAPIPPELASVRELPNLMKFIELRLNLTRPAPSSLSFTSNNAEDAAKLAAIFAQLKQAAVDGVKAEIERDFGGDDPVKQAMRSYQQRTVDHLYGGIELTQKEDRLFLFETELSTGANPMIATATIGILIALLLPAVQAAREAARRNSSMNNMKQIMLGMLNYESARGMLPAYANFDDAGKPLLSWRVHILPFMELAPLYERFKLDEPWDSEHNKQLIPLMPQVFFDPSSKLAQADGKTHYLGVTGAPYFFDGTRDGHSLKDIEDGTADTIALVQVDDDHVAIWTKPADWSPDAKDLKKGTGRLHQGDIFLAAFSDGSVKVVSQNVDPMALMFMFTVAGGERLNDP
jgi:hypothetical protein